MIPMQLFDIIRCIPINYKYNIVEKPYLFSYIHNHNYISPFINFGRSVSRKEIKFSI